MQKVLAFALLAASVSPAAAIAADTADSNVQSVDVAYEALSEGRTAEAIASLDGSAAVQTSDPAALINLGTAYARQGRIAEARAMFTAAAESRERYSLEMADGSWVDSRKVAKLALKNLEKSNGIAMR
ncbi:tetratricopeptide repeat protein [Erythrobacter sp. SG61-1L]|uniref:tetratricopeptide repeat protein n=1 Tax=Erythrobacter sp. SG61-1L TaxID=1603897 RepID=UPI000B189995|nr:tetratricopeptide repeat protein [Erythrobacter sp. SG61-1L]